jgi:endoglucanase
MNTKIFITLCLFILVKSVNASPTTTTELIRIDQFGYRPTDQKIAVISLPQTGYNAPSSFAPGSVYQVRDWFSDAIVLSGTPVAWNSGSVNVQSGDKAFWFDFSVLTTSGSYYIFDVSNNVGSYRFEIGQSVYNEALKQATRMLFYQRCGMAKGAPYAQTGWTDLACHKGANQDTDCRLYNYTNVSTSKNLSGGWHDAGDHNKYVNFTYSAMVNLLLAYRENPTIWTDNYNIPESGNGIPDLLDEVKYELDWLLKMQNSNGSVISVLGIASGNTATPPSTDTLTRIYGPATTSATFTSAAIFALAAIQFNSVGQTTYATTLQTASINAYNWATANPGITFYNTGVIAAGEQEVDAYESSSRRLAAAVYLYALTNAVAYKTYVDTNYTSLHLLAWGYAYPFETAQQDAALYYASLSSATAVVKTAINNAFSNSMSTNNADNLPNFMNSTDPYRSYIANNNWTWNSNQTKSSQGNMFYAMNVFNLNTTNATNYKNAASGFVHYFHGVNPNGKTFLSNMGSYGAENSVKSFYHAWFANGNPLWDEVGVSTYGPPPGFIPGGPNPSYTLDPCCPSGCGGSNALCSTNVSPPLSQPIQKSYKDFNDSWPLNSWTITEPGIYTNAAYIRLVSKFSGSSSLGVNENEIIANNRIILYPSPAKNEVNISFVGIDENNFSLSIIDLSGKVLMSKKINLTGNDRINTTNVTSLSSGLYLFKIQGNNFAITKRVVVE